MFEISLLVTALLFGGMVFYSFSFAAVVFNALSPETAGPLIRRAFPHFYLFVLVSSAVAASIAFAFDPVSGAILIAIAITKILARQVLMPAINTATDAGSKTRFKVLHSLSVVITLAHSGQAFETTIAKGL
ncbi:MAG: DUF4149 domain-containing protein [Shimia sp.]|jgi:prepilin signal peptidase PulO-like enzyme (type II secretory pathway)|uniref:DUF4149 domain-containing protein n=1 Tax=Shimia sp. TaxID=1954381 RepID=UPI0040582D91